MASALWCIWTPSLVTGQHCSEGLSALSWGELTWATLSAKLHWCLFLLPVDPILLCSWQSLLLECRHCWLASEVCKWSFRTGCLWVSPEKYSTPFCGTEESTAHRHQCSLEDFVPVAENCITNSWICFLALPTDVNGTWFLYTRKEFECVRLLLDIFGLLLVLGNSAMFQLSDVSEVMWLFSPWGIGKWVKRSPQPREVSCALARSADHLAHIGIRSPCLLLGKVLKVLPNPAGFSINSKVVRGVMRLVSCSPMSCQLTLTTLFINKKLVSQKPFSSPCMAEAMKFMRRYI